MTRDRRKWRGKQVRSEERVEPVECVFHALLDRKAEE
jgi:hypothetical protein